MREIVDYFELISQAELKELLGDIAEAEADREKISRASPDKLEGMFFSELHKATNLSSSVSDRNTILRQSLELLMKKLHVPFTKNLNDEALFWLFRRYIGEKILEYVRPMLLAGYLMARCDNEFHHDEKQMLTFFIRNLDVLDEVKKEFLAEFLTNAEKLYKQAAEVEPVELVASVCASQDDEYNEHILRFCFTIAMVDEKVKRQELVFHETLARKLDIAPGRVLEIRDEVEEAHKRTTDVKQLGKDLGCQHFNVLVLHTAASEIGTKTLKSAGMVFLTGVVGFAIYGVSKLFRLVDYKKLNALLTSLVIKVEEEVKEERVVEIRNVFEKLAVETGEMLSIVANIHFYLNNMQKTYSEVSDQAWLKGLWGQLSPSNRKKLTVGSTLLKEVVHDVSRLLAKILEHQHTIATAINEHLRLISLSEELQSAVRELVGQNRQLVELVQEAENAGVSIAA